MTDIAATDLEIGRAADLLPIEDVAAAAGIAAEHLEPYGRYVAKVAPTALAPLADQPLAKYVVITAVTPTPLGEGKTTTSIGLAQALAHLGHRSMLSLRQPSLGPTFGIKGGAAGAGYSQVVPMQSINLHLTGDFHAVTAAHNLLTAMVDNHLHHGNDLGIDARTITWRRVLDVNDRSLRNVVVGLGDRMDGVPRQAGFDITAASEVMVILSLATSLQDLQTLENTPALLHTGPFGNIATGNSSVVADLLGIRAADFLITEAGFGADMGAERFFDVKCRTSGLRPDAAVVVVTVRALKTHSGRHRVVAGRPLPPAMLDESPDDVRLGGPNLVRHIEIVRRFGVSPVVAINAFPGDHDSEHDVIREIAEQAGARVAVTRHVADGGKGALDLAALVVEAAGEPTAFRYLYELQTPLTQKIEVIAREIYGADGVDLAPAVVRDLQRFEELGYGSFPVVIAKTHLSLSSDPTLSGAPTGWRMPVREVRAAVGAGYVYAICGQMRTMPGLPRHPAAESIDIDEDGNVVGLS